MSFGNFSKLWFLSASVYPESNIKYWPRRARLVLSCLLTQEVAYNLVNSPRESVIGRLIRERPETIGAVVWPYQCAAWRPRERLERITQHCELVEALGKPVDLGANDKVVLGDLGFIRSDLWIVLDQPKWFMREGNLVINLFFNRVRMFSLAFSLMDNGGLTAVVGAIQGRDLEGAIDDYRDLTKASSGMRPRDLTFEIFKMLCAEIGVKRILAVSDEARHHRHPFFGDPSKEFSTNYDEIWDDRGGKRVSREFFELEVNASRKKLEDIPAKKRGMYRRRFEMLDAIQIELHNRYQRAKMLDIYESIPGFDL